MKTSQDPRHLRRVKIMQELFAWNFNHEQPLLDETSKAIIAEASDIDRQITEFAPSWPLNKINKIDLAILRLAIYEVTHSDTPQKVILDEAIELAKAYGSESSSAFINGVLGKVISGKKD